MPEKNYKEVVDETKKEIEEERHKKWVDTVKNAVKETMKKIKSVEKEIKEATERLEAFNKQLEDIEGGNVEYDEDGTRSAIVIEDKKTGKKIRMKLDGEISDTVTLSCSDSNVIGTCITMG